MVLWAKAFAWRTCSTRAHAISHEWVHLIRLRLFALSRVERRWMTSHYSHRYFNLWAAAANINVVIVIVVVVTTLWRTLDWCLCLSCHHGTLTAGWLCTRHRLITDVVGHCWAAVVLDVSQLKADDLDAVGVEVPDDAGVRRYELGVTERRADDIRLNVERTFSTSVNLHSAHTHARTWARDTLMQFDWCRASLTPCWVQDRHTGVQGTERLGTSIPGRRLQLGQRWHSPTKFSCLLHVCATKDKDKARW